MFVYLLRISNSIRRPRGQGAERRGRRRPIQEKKGDTASKTPSLRLADDVFACVSQNHVVFLDLANDAYSAVPLDDAERAGVDTPILDQIGSRHVELEAAGLLTTAPSGAPNSARSPLRVERHLFEEADRRAFGLHANESSAYAVRPRDVVDFVWSCWTASRDLRTRPINTVIRSVQLGKSVRARPSDHSDDLKRQICVFSRLRPWYPRPYLCLFDALALLRFLARKGHYAAWVFGVHIQPFDAHCWVQLGSVLLNENLEYAGRFTPIMEV